jgi:hypothetical protein
MHALMQPIDQVLLLLCQYCADVIQSYAQV